MVYTVPKAPGDPYGRGWSLATLWTLVVGLVVVLLVAWWLRGYVTNNHRAPVSKPCPTDTVLP